MATLTTLVSFDGVDGQYPVSGLITDANGDLFGTAETDGASGGGTVFEIVKTPTGYASTPATLVSFDGNNGANPLAGLLADANVDLFGTTLQGGPYGLGTVFEIVNDFVNMAQSSLTASRFQIG